MRLSTRALILGLICLFTQAVAMAQTNVTEGEVKRNVDGYGVQIGYNTRIKFSTNIASNHIKSILVNASVPTYLPGVESIIYSKTVFDEEGKIVDSLYAPSKNIGNWVTFRNNTEYYLEYFTGKIHVGVEFTDYTPADLKFDRIASDGESLGYWTTSGANCYGGQVRLARDKKGYGPTGLYRTNGYAYPMYSTYCGDYTNNDNTLEWYLNASIVADQWLRAFYPTDPEFIQTYPNGSTYGYVPGSYSMNIVYGMYDSTPGPTSEYVYLCRNQDQPLPDGLISVTHEGYPCKYTGVYDIENNTIEYLTESNFGTPLICARYFGLVDWEGFHNPQPVGIPKPMFVPPWFRNLHW